MFSKSAASTTLISAACSKLREGDVERGAPVTPKLGRLKFDEAAKAVVNDYTMNRRDTLKQVERRIDNHLAPFFGGRRMTGITTDLVTEYAAERQKAGASSAEINRELAVLKRAFSLAVKAGKLMGRPHIPMLQEHNVRTGFFEREQFDAVHKRVPASLQPVLTFAYFTGWRIPSEVLTLQWSQVDLTTGTVRLEPGSTKNDEGRVFYVGDIPELRDALKAQRTRTEELQRKLGKIIPHVFHRNGSPIRSFYGRWATACKAAGCPGPIPHDLRRTAVRNLVRARVPEAVAMKLTGHKTRSVFDRYNIVSDGDLRQAAQRLALAQ